MSYFDHQQPHKPYQPPFRQPAVAYPVDEAGARVYAEEDYAMPEDGDAFLPDDAPDGIAEPYDDPFAAPPALSYMGAYDTLTPDDAEDLQPEEATFYDEYMLTDEERAELRRSSWQLFATLADFGGVILGTVVILVLVALLVSLLNWLVNDVTQTFTLLQMQF